MPPKKDDQPTPPPTKFKRRIIQKRFRVDLLERMEALAGLWQPPVSVTQLLELAAEQLLEKHEGK